MSEQGIVLDLVAPGFLGINTEREGAILDPQWCTEALNAVLDTSGRLASRKGWTTDTTTAIAGSKKVRSLWEFKKADETVEMIVAWDGGISNDIADPEGNDISGSVTDADGNWWFQNFRDVCLGFQAGQKFIRYTGTGNFVTVVESNGTAPSGAVGLCAFGRVFGLDADGVTIKYSVLLDETDWASTGSGTIDMTSVWTDGTDTVTGLFAFNGNLVVFGKRHVVIFTDGQGSELGIDPAQIYVTEAIAGTGLISQWTVQPVGETDILYLSRNGVQSLNRTIQEKSNPVKNLTKANRAQIRDDFDSSVSPDTMRSAYSPEEGLYFLTSPGIRTWVMDQRRRPEDADGDQMSITTRWDLAPTAWAVRGNGAILLGDDGQVGTYSGVSDDGTAFTFTYLSPWLDFGEEVANRLKMLKRISSILFISAGVDVEYTWDVDFGALHRTFTQTFTGGSAEWGQAEWGVAEWSGTLKLVIQRGSARATGQYFRIGIEAVDITGTLALQQLQMFLKLGRIA